MVEEGLLENPKVDFAMALHVEPQFPLEAADYRPGSCDGVSRFFSLTFAAKEGMVRFLILLLIPLPRREAYTMLQGLK